MPIPRLHTPTDGRALFTAHLEQASANAHGRRNLADRVLQIARVEAVRPVPPDAELSPDQVR